MHSTHMPVGFGEMAVAHMQHKTWPGCERAPLFALFPNMMFYSLILLLLLSFFSLLFYRALLCVFVNKCLFPAAAITSGACVSIKQKGNKIEKKKEKKKSKKIRKETHQKKREKETPFKDTRCCCCCCRFFLGQREREGYRVAPLGVRLLFFCVSIEKKKKKEWPTRSSCSSRRLFFSFVF